MSEWRDIEDPPEAPTSVQFYWADAEWRDWNTGEVADIPDLHAVRYTVGYWDGDCWRESGTNHDLFEFGDERETPTHWMPLPTPPEV